MTFNILHSTLKLKFNVVVQPGDIPRPKFSLITPAIHVKCLVECKVHIYSLHKVMKKYQEQTKAPVINILSKILIPAKGMSVK